MSATMPNVKAVSDNNSGKFIQVLIFNLLFSVQGRTQFTVPIAEILSGKNVRAWVSMVVT